MVRTFDFGREGDALFYTMEYQPGTTLDNVLRASPLPIEGVVGIARQLLRGILAIHAVGVVHRDLKPSNIIVADSGILKITDFGIARVNAAPLTVANSDILGTVAYIAPEVLEGAGADRAVDFYALGVVLFEALAGHLPFNDENPARLIFRKVNEEPPSIRQLRPEAPIWLADTVCGLLQRNPESRIKASIELAENLDMTRGKSRQEFLTEEFNPVQVKNDTIRIARGAKQSRLRVGYLLLLLGLVALSVPLSSLETIAHLDAYQLDLLFRFRGERQPPSDVVQVAIDEQSYLQFGVPLTSAWPRALHARLLRALAQAGATRVVFDVIFSGASPEKLADRDFASAISRVPTVLGAALGVSQRATANGSFLLEELIAPDLIFERESVGIGAVGLPLRLGRVRGFFDSTSNVFPQVRGLAEMAVTLDRKSQESPGSRGLINFYGARGTIPTIPYEMVISSGALAGDGVTNNEPDNLGHLNSVFRNKVVFVGLSLKSSTGPAQRDAFSTPYDHATFGTEIHATAAANLLYNDWIRQLSAVNQCLVVVLVALVVGSTLSITSGTSLILTSIIWLLICGSVEFILFKSGWFVPIGFGCLWGLGIGGVVSALRSERKPDLAGRIDV